MADRLKEQTQRNWKNLWPIFSKKWNTVITSHGACASMEEKNGLRDLFHDTNRGRKIDWESSPGPFPVKNCNSTKAYPDASQTSKIELFVKLVSSSQQLTIFAKHSVFDTCVCSECVFAVVSDRHHNQKWWRIFNKKWEGWNPKAGKAAQERGLNRNFLIDSNSYDGTQVQIPLQKSLIEIFRENSFYDPQPYNKKIPRLFNSFKTTVNVDPIAFTIIN